MNSFATLHPNALYLNGSCLLRSWETLPPFFLPSSVPGGPYISRYFFPPRLAPFATYQYGVRVSPFGRVTIKSRANFSKVLWGPKYFSRRQSRNVLGVTVQCTAS